MHGKLLKGFFTSVSYTHLDVYKRQHAPTHTHTHTHNAYIKGELMEQPENSAVRNKENSTCTVVLGLPVGFLCSKAVLHRFFDIHFIRGPPVHSIWNNTNF